MLINLIDLMVLLIVLFLVIMVIFLRFYLPKIKEKAVNRKNSIKNDN